MTDLPVGWATQPLGDLLVSPKDLTYGIVQPGADFPGGIPIVRVKDIRGGIVSVDEPLRVAPAIEESYARSRIRGGELLVTLVGTVGESAIASPTLRGWNTARAIAVVRVREDVTAAWVKYALSAPSCQARLRTRLNTTVQSTLNLSDLRELPIVVPPSIERRGIAEVLGALDDKIESNRRLSSVALALSRERRRVVVANAVAREPLSALVQINPTVRKPGEPDDELLYIDIASVSPGRVESAQRMTWREAPSRARRVVQDGDVIFSTVRPGRRSFALLLDPEPETIVSTGFATLTPGRIGSAFLAAIVSELEFAEYLESVAQGSAYPAVTSEALGQFETYVPSAEVLREVESEMVPILRRAAVARREEDKLTALRDALLPELLSGRLRVKDAEQVAGAVT